MATKITDLWDLRNRDRAIHFIGIGGIGMSALARWFLAEGWSVSGSDLEHTALTAELSEEGAVIKMGQKQGNLGRPAAVVYTSAVPPTNPEFIEAQRRGLPLYSYPQLLGEVSRRYETVAIAGAHGKSTTTAMVSLIFKNLGLDPTVIIGTKLRELGGKNFRSGKSKYLVLEADEYKKAFLNYSPAFLIVTNIDREHLDCYKNLADIKRTFLQLFRQILPGGTIILNGDDPNLTIMEADIERIAKNNRLSLMWYSRQDPVAKKIKAALKVPGQHNLSDAAAAFTLATAAFGLPEDKVLKALGKYRGSWRRYEYKGYYRLGGTAYRVFDDYAHHPTEIKSTLAAFREKFPATTLVCVFQPHQAERLKRLFKDFADSFKDADVLVFIPAYQVAGREQAESRYTAQALAASIAKKNLAHSVLYLPEPENLSRPLIRELVRRTDADSRRAVVVMMGAGTIVNYTPLLIGPRAKS